MGCINHYKIILQYFCLLLLYKIPAKMVENLRLQSEIVISTGVPHCACISQLIFASVSYKLTLLIIQTS